jgi:O-methyltransferase
VNIVTSETWDSNEDFKALLKLIDNVTVITPDRLFMLYQLSKYASNLQGDMAEVGVYKGGSAKLIAKACPDKKIHLFDTFSGLPAGSPEHLDTARGGEFSDTSLESVKNFMSDCNNVVFHPGLFPDSVPTKLEKLCFVHMDVDIYKSARSCLEYFYPKLVSGGILVSDDFEWPGCEGVPKAIKEFLSRKKETYIVAAKYQCFIIKL